MDNCPRTFGSQSMPPVVRSQPPAEFDTEWRFEIGNAHADESKEGSVMPELGCAKAKTVLVEMSFEFVHEGIAIFPR